MAVKPVYILLLWELALLIHGVTSFCNVTCSTDYDVMLNCSCSHAVPRSVLINVNCRDFDTVVNGSCEIHPPQSWCKMDLENLYIVASIGTNCTSTASQQSEVIMEASESSSWELSEVVKPEPPFSVQVSVFTDGFYTISWDHNNKANCLIYRVRIRQSNNLSEGLAHSLSAEGNHILLDHNKLQPHCSYTVDVQAKMCPDNIYHGPWSEWSSTAEWRTTETDEQTKGINRWWWCVSLVIVLVLLLLGCSQKPFWQKKIQLITYVPRPNDFFKPLYHNYGGNFKAWVKPVFGEYDYLGVNPHVPVMSEKQHDDILHWNNENQSYTEDSETKHSGHFLHVLPHSNMLLHFQDCGSSQGMVHSTGHISIHTVTLSGKGFGEEVISQSSINSLRSYQDGENFNSFEEDNREHAGHDLGEPPLSGMDIQSGILPQHENQLPGGLPVGNINFEPHAQYNEPERVSLDSFVSNGQSEDGYPHVDLDTIDSGFVECSSPGASDSNPSEQIDSDLFNEHKTSSSNYVKQWMICNTIQEDSSNLENDLHEAQ
uniref:Fibronectin type-III domain-containing protein n=1 Tax=Monopterus albus TaxID=43700 RepID=A0A3Q3JBA9_MONAL|nr:interleukin-21 receptor-like [Monopterus albus]XP_020465319.1 interleukin-21 receptor-like [Monopterus albus]